jgi:hypothetical protein
MKLKEILDLAIDEKISYPAALEELYKLKLGEQETEDYKNLLYKILGGKEKVDHSPLILMEFIPNEYYSEYLMFTIKSIRQGANTAEIVNALCSGHRLGPQLATYFVNEALSIVRMNDITPEEFVMMGEAYEKMKKENFKNVAPPKTNINAEEIATPDAIAINIEEEEE